MNTMHSSYLVTVEERLVLICLSSKVFIITMQVDFSTELYIFLYFTERALEDHELVMEVLSNWAMEEENRLYFRKNYAKYEFFKNPGVSHETLICALGAYDEITYCLCTFMPL